MYRINLEHPVVRKLDEIVIETSFMMTEEQTRKQVVLVKETE